jgi:hypothetical protein
MHWLANQMLHLKVKLLLQVKKKAASISEKSFFYKWKRSHGRLRTIKSLILYPGCHILYHWINIVLKFVLRTTYLADIAFWLCLKIRVFFEYFCPIDFGPGRQQFLATPLRTRLEEKESKRFATIFKTWFQFKIISIANR